MNVGLVSMGHNYLSQPTPSTSSATLNSILTTTASPVIPQKRKQSQVDQLEQSYFRLTHSPPALPSPRSNGAESNDADPNDTSTEAVDCICGFAVDDGFSIACDECSRWCHSACFGIAKGSVPEKFACWTCKPRSAIDKEKAVRLQKEKLGMADGEPKQRRRSSPGLDRRQRRGPNVPAATTPLDPAAPGKKKRRPSMTLQPLTPIATQTTPNGVPEEEQVDIDNDPWKEYYVHIAHDIIPNDDTRAKLRHQAVHWRGVTAVSHSLASSSLESPPPVSVKPLPPQSSLNPFLSQNSNPLVLPPAFSLHTTQSIPSHTLITPFRSCITPSSTYLADPLNAYAHLGMPKPFVHLLGPPLDVALDARIVGNHGRFARWGCKPNAVLRPILCERGSKETDDETTLGFGVFTTKDMKADEEIVLGWEWDDGNIVHLLPVLLEAPDTFPLLTSLSTNRPHKIQHIKNQMSNILHALSSTFTTCACGALSKDCALTQMAAFIDGHDLGSLLRKMDQPNELDSEDDIAKIDLGPLVGKKRGFRTRERVPQSGGLGGMQMANDEERGNGRGIIWDGKQPYKEGISLPGFVISPFSPTPTKMGKEQALAIEEDDMEMMGAPAKVGGSELSKVSIDSLIIPSSTPPSEPINNPPSQPRPPDPPDGGGGDAIFDEAEERMPPKMRKKWMHRELEARKEPLAKACQVGLEITFDLQGEHLLMPPPPMPASMDPTTISSTSANRSVPNQHRPVSPSPNPTPSTSTDLTTMSPPPSASGVSPLASFAQLSLFSPAFNSDIPSQPELPTRCPEKSETGIEEGLNVDIIEEPEVSVKSTSEANSPTPIISPAVSGTKDGLTQDLDCISNPLSALDLPVPGLSRTRPIYSYRQDEDDEVDYSPQSPEPSSNMDEQSHEVLPQFHPNSSDAPEGTELISHSVLDNPGESCNDVETSPDDQATSVTAPNLPPSNSILTPLPTNPTSDLASPNPEPEPSSKPSSDQLQPPPKVKLTLKDFALRKKRQREEQALSQTIRPSPLTSSPLLEREEEVKSPPITKTQVEVSERRDYFILDDPHPSPVASRSLVAARHVANVTEEGSTSGQMGVMSTNDSPRNDTTTTQEESENKMDQPPLPPTTSIAKSSLVTPNGHLHMPLWPNRPQPPLLLPPLPTQQPAIPKINTHDLKQEMIESLVPSLLQRVSDRERSVSPISPDPVPMVNRVSLEEEGEIGETLFSSRGPSSRREPNNSHLLTRNGPHLFHSPPTAPRFYLNPSTSPSSIRPTMSPIPSMTPNNTNGNRPNTPTAPRAFRTSMLQHRSGSGPPATSHPPVLPQNNVAGSSLIPRGPSADREKERDRLEWEQRHYRAPLRRGAGSGRGTPWGR